MNRSKLGLRLTSSLLVSALVVMPTNELLAAPPPAQPDAVEAPAEGETPPEGEAPAEGETPVEGETPPEGETPAEGETPPEGETPMEIETPAEPGEGEGEPAEGEGEVEEPTEEEPAELEAPGPQRPPEPTWGGSRKRDPRPLNGTGLIISGGVTTGLGVAFLITSVLITRCEYGTALNCQYGEQRDFLVPTAVAATALGVMLLGVGLGTRSKYKKWQSWTPENTALGPAIVPGGGGVAWVGRF